MATAAEIAAAQTAATPNKLVEFLNKPLVKAALTLGVCYGVHKFVKHPAAKAAAYGVAGVVVLKSTPVVKDHVAL